MAAKSEAHEHGLAREDKCYDRPDDIGLWNFIKAWHWFPLHLACCIAFLVVMLVYVDSHTFMTGEPPDFSDRVGRLYQTEVTGLVSVVLVFIRLLAGIGSTLIVWRLIFLLLEKTGLTIAELCRIVDNKLPIAPRFESGGQILWSCFTILVVILLWPQTVAAPLANSSLAWTPSSELAHTKPDNYTLSTLEDPAKQATNFWYDNTITSISFVSAFMAGKDPGYAFEALNESQIPLRRYAYLDPPLNNGGIGSLDMPYFEVVKIDWLNASTSQNDPLYVWNKASMLSNALISTDFPTEGTLGFYRETQWATNETLQYESNIFEVKKNVSIMVDGIHINQTLPDGTNPDSTTPCPTYGPIFGKMPPVTRWPEPLSYGTPGHYKWVATYCFMLAEVTIRAGKYPSRPSNTTLVGAFDHIHAMTPLEPILDPVANASLVADGSVMPVLDMMSDVSRLIMSLNLTSQYRYNNLDNFVKGMLTMAYQTTWSALPVHIADATETALITPMEPVILASVNRSRLYGWLGMNATLTLAAVLVGVAHHAGTKRTKTVRDATLAALTMDLTDITHRSGSGLCNAAALNGEDHMLGRMKWRDDGDAKDYHLSGGEGAEGCPREVVFVHEGKKVV